ncbi:MAG: hypothetical protein V1913_07890 [Fibrobacterota bacterium]
MKSLIFPVLLSAALAAAASFSIKVTRVDGSAQIKSEGSRQWDPLKSETDLYDNDVLQTSFKSNCEIRIQNDNILFMGANSRLLVNFVEKAGGDFEVSITLFSGSVYSNISGALGYVVYSTTATGRAGKASFNTTVDEATGITAFHIFKGDVTVSNLSVQGDQPLRSGETSTIAPGAQPAPPRRISSKQMSVLTRFYGSEFINKEIERTGLEMEKSPVAESLAPVEAREEQIKPNTAAGAAKQPQSIKLFNKDEILRKIEEDKENFQRMYRKLTPYDPLLDYSYRVAALYSMHNYNGTGYGDAFVRPGFFSKRASLVLNLPVTADSLGAMSMNASGARGLLDKIYSADFRYKQSFVHLGDIDGLTFGRGLALREYSNRVYNDNVRNLGLFAHYQGYYNSVDFFTSSIADFHLLGFQYRSIDTTGGFGVAFVRENSQALDLNNSDFGFRSGGHPLPSGVPADSFASSGAVSFGQFDFSVYVFNVKPIRVELYGEFCGLFLGDNYGNLKGYSLSLPGGEVTWGRVLGRVEAFISKNTFPRGFFGPFYEDNLFMLRRDSTGAVTGRQVLVSALQKENTAIGLNAGLHGTPLRGLTVGADFESILLHYGGVDTSMGASGRAGQRPKVDGNNNGLLDFRINVGKGLNKHLPWLEAHYRIAAGGYYAGKAFSPLIPNPFTSYGVTAQGFFIGRLTASFGWEAFYYDHNGDNRATADEKVTGFTAALGAGF